MPEQMYHVTPPLYKQEIPPSYHSYHSQLSPICAPTPTQYSPTSDYGGSPQHSPSAFVTSDMENQYVHSPESPQQHGYSPTQQLSFSYQQVHSPPQQVHSPIQQVGSPTHQMSSPSPHTDHVTFSHSPSPPLQDRVCPIFEGQYSPVSSSQESQYSPVKTNKNVRVPKIPPLAILQKRRLAANGRERKRMNSINGAFDRLRKVLPGVKDRDLSKFESLQMAQQYIIELMEILQQDMPQ